MARSSSPKKVWARGRCELDRLVRKLEAYFSTSEGIALSDRIHEFLERHRRSETPKLPPNEAPALAFITGRFKHREHSSVRDVARALGFRSSRTGFLIIQNLVRKGYLTRDQKEPS